MAIVTVYVSIPAQAAKNDQNSLKARRANDDEPPASGTSPSPRRRWRRVQKKKTPVMMKTTGVRPSARRGPGRARSRSTSRRSRTRSRTVRSPRGPARALPVGVVPCAASDLGPRGARAALLGRTRSRPGRVRSASIVEAFPKIEVPSTQARDSDHRPWHRPSHRARRRRRPARLRGRRLLGRRNNPELRGQRRAADRGVAGRGEPVVFVRHDSDELAAAARTSRATPSGSRGVGSRTCW